MAKKRGGLTKGQKRGIGVSAAVGAGILLWWLLRRRGPGRQMSQNTLSIASFLPVNDGFNPSSIVITALTGASFGSTATVLVRCELYDSTGALVGDVNQGLQSIPGLNVPVAVPFYWHDPVTNAQLQSFSHGTYTAKFKPFDCPPFPPLYGPSCLLAGVEYDVVRFSM